MILPISALIIWQSASRIAVLLVALIQSIDWGASAAWHEALRGRNWRAYNVGQ